MAPVPERPGPVALTCHVCGRPNVRLCTDKAYEAHTQWEQYDRLCPALWPKDKQPVMRHLTTHPLGTDPERDEAIKRGWERS